MNERYSHHHHIGKWKGVRVKSAKRPSLINMIILINRDIKIRGILDSRYLKDFVMRNLD